MTAMCLSCELFDCASCDYYDAMPEYGCCCGSIRPEPADSDDDEWEDEDDSTSPNPLRQQHHPLPEGRVTNDGDNEVENLSDEGVHTLECADGPQLVEVYA